MSYEEDSLFIGAFEKLMRWEGGYSNNPKDRGGTTNYGISLRFYKSIKPDATEEEIGELSKSDAAQLYYDHWWVPNKYREIDYTVAVQVFNFAVWMGAKRAHKLLQRAIMATSGEPLKIDGIVGPKTKEALKKCEPGRVVSALRSEAGGRIRWLLRADPSQKVFEKGWLRRAYNITGEDLWT